MKKRTHRELSLGVRRRRHRQDYLTRGDTFLRGVSWIVFLSVDEFAVFVCKGVRRSSWTDARLARSSFSWCCASFGSFSWLVARWNQRMFTIALFGQPLGCFATYQNMLGWETYKYYHETDELPNPRPTEPKRKRVKRGIWTAFFPQQIIVRVLGLIFFE